MDNGNQKSYLDILLEKQFVLLEIQKEAMIHTSKCWYKESMLRNGKIPSLQSTYLPRSFYHFQTKATAPNLVALKGYNSNVKLSPATFLRETNVKRLVIDRAWMSKEKE